jgi:hypothetical protein
MIRTYKLLQRCGGSRMKEEKESLKKNIEEFSPNHSFSQWEREIGRT